MEYTNGIWYAAEVSVWITNPSIYMYNSNHEMLQQQIIIGKNFDEKNGRMLAILTH